MSTGEKTCFATLLISLIALIVVGFRLLNASAMAIYG